MSDLGLLTILAVRLRSRGTAAVIVETVVELHAGDGSDLSAHVDRILAAAVDDPAWVDAPGLDSIHTVWFELHEHLLASLGRARVDER